MPITTAIRLNVEKTGARRGSEQNGKYASVHDITR